MAAEFLIKNVDQVIGKLARLSKIMKQMPSEIRVSKEARQVFINRMKHFKCYEDSPIWTKNSKPLSLFKVPIVEQPGVANHSFVVVWLDYDKLLRRRDKKF